LNLSESQLTPYPGHDEFVFDTPLYSKHQISKEETSELINKPLTIDGYCSRCGVRRVFNAVPPVGGANTRITQTGHTYYDDILRFTCAKEKSHQIAIYLRIVSGTIVKLGQNPSYADIVTQQDADRTKTLQPQDRREYNKAVGLAAHDAGIGAYAYLRRIFERLIWTRFNDHRANNGWDEADFKRKRMDEKISLLKDYLPELLVKNAGTYSLLSDGLHNLSEEGCLAYFPILRSGILLILQQDIERKQREANEAEFSKAVSTFKPTT
jgi:hypothetical protein